MVVSVPYLKRPDGVVLYKTYDAIKQEDGTYIPSGLKIKKIGTDEIYSFAIDLEGFSFSYETTDIQIMNDEDFPNLEDISDIE